MNIYGVSFLVSQLDKLGNGSLLGTFKKYELIQFYYTIVNK